MKIAIPVKEMSFDSEIYDSFGRAPYYLLYHTESKRSEFLDHRAIVIQGGAGIRAVQVLADQGVRAIITPQCGENAEKMLRNSEVLVYQSIPGSILQNIDAYNKDQLNLLQQFKSKS